MQKFIRLSINDIFSKQVIFFVVKMGLLSLVITLAIVWSFGEVFSSLIVGYLSWIPWEWLQTTGAKFLLLISSYMFFIILISLLTSLFSEKLLIQLSNKHYPNLPIVGSADVQTSVYLSLKTSVIFLLLFVLFIPLLFVPVLGQALMLYLWSILIHAPTRYDIASLYIQDKKQMKLVQKKTRRLALVAVLWNYIPLLNIFAALFAQLLFLHSLAKDLDYTSTQT